jgi:predicted O-methyltransferase YrrM
MQWGRFRTWITAVTARPRLLADRRLAWSYAQPLASRYRSSFPYNRPSDRLARFARHVLELRREVGRPRYLEIGAFEGQSLALISALLEKNCAITVIDPFDDYIEQPGTDMTTVYGRFTRNIAELDLTGITRVLRGKSIEYLPQLIAAGESFDLIYVDGSHETIDVLLDACLCWRLLAPGGLIIFDDYWWRMPALGRRFRPKLAVDAFAGAASADVRVLDVAGQVFLKKT